MKKYNIIKKESYTLPQKANLISIRQYLFVKENNKIFLILKLCNDSNEQVSDVRFNIKQLNIDGKVLKEEKVDYRSLDVKQGEEFAPFKLYQLEDKCDSIEATLEIAAFQSFVFNDGKKIVFHQENIIAIANPKTLVNKTDEYYVRERKPRVLSFMYILASIAMVFSFVTPFVISLFNTDGPSKQTETFSYFVDDNGYITIDDIRLDNDKKEVTIPEKINGTFVKRLSQGSIPSDVKTITIPCSVKLDDYLFDGCDALTDVFFVASANLTDYAIEIPSNCFSGCEKLKNVWTRASYISKIGYRAFSECKSLNYIDVRNVISIGEEGFVGCSTLSSINISESKLLDVGSHAFSFCSSLQTVTLPALRVENWDGLFYKCDRMTSLTLGSDDFHNIFTSVSRLFGLPNNYYDEMPGLENITLVNPKYSIPEGFYSNLRGLKEFTISYTEYTSRKLTINKGAFEYCSNLNKVTIPNVEYISERAFNTCRSLQEVYAPDVTYVGSYAFSNIWFGTDNFVFSDSVYIEPDAFTTVY